MATFDYKAFDASGVKVESSIDAISILEARKQLQKDGLLITKISQQRKSISLFSNEHKKASFADLEFMTSELSILLASGVKIDKGLGILAKGAKSGAIGKLIREIQGNLKKGLTIAEAFKTKSNVFDPLYLNLIAIGEATGRLAETFKGLADDLKFKKELKAKVSQALSYPMVILFVCIVCILFVLNYIVPQMGSIFSENDELPVYTAILLGASDWMIRYQWWAFLVLSLMGGMMFRLRKKPQFQAFVGQRVLSVPVLSTLILQVERIRFNSAMALMLEAGLKVDSAIDHAAKNVKNPILNNSLKIARDKVKKGNSVSHSLSQTLIYPDFYISLLEVGEESGRLGDVFTEIAGRSKFEFEQWINRTTSLLEPLLILVMGGIVGSVVVTMLLSVVSVNDINL
jgi:general secretion pathway protein F